MTVFDRWRWCSDPDVVPESHISPHLKSGSVEPEPSNNFRSTPHYSVISTHTSWSIDAYAGENRLGPNAAYRFAKGEKVTLQTGEEAQLQTPLDFVALTDHARALRCTFLHHDARVPRIFG